MPTNDVTASAKPVQAGLWIVVGDIHDETGNFDKIPELKDANGVIISGDLTQLGGREAARQVLKIFGKAGLPLYAQTGNMDKAEVDELLTDLGINLHGKVLELARGVAIFGIGGSVPTPFHTPTEYSETAYSEWLSSCWKEASSFPAQILISHNPPFDTSCDRISNGAHVGSRAVREFIEQHQPNLCVCGHIHEAAGTDRIGKTRIINPGMLSAGGYAIIRIADGLVQSEIRHF